LEVKVLNLVQQFLQWLVQQYHKMLKTFSGVVLLLLHKFIAALVAGLLYLLLLHKLPAALVAGQVDGVLKVL
jgi:hypothetical protein